ncbi:polyphosphate polymerase domain-containing protein [Edaphobacillus lindanitolerans]|uniref:VTC domain-containing protein n=1 Tax=Edaphobacillus lindanitolerans TaxID=550447 RepID=A0A1U7PTC1_9BACI|nr:polyphosphate polymerase domain-containing protein [Edaphobacillus lindanitolerans]SIT91931.1 VTC domain-containing protein [Edaphobacillus lindanitolerans]
MAIEIFTRRELKFLITVDQYRRLLLRAGNKLRADKNGKDGRYTVTTLYFDNDESRIYYEVKNRLKFRQKLRLRVYDETGPDGRAFFEMKQKNGRIVHKRRTGIPLREAYRYIRAAGTVPAEQFAASNAQVLKEIGQFRAHYGLQPDMVVSYDRHALHQADDPAVRVTFDYNLRCRKHDLFLESGPHGQHFVDPGLVVLEVKVDNSVPLWLTRILQEAGCLQKGGSKFCLSHELLANGQRELMIMGGR